MKKIIGNKGNYTLGHYGYTPNIGAFSSLDSLFDSFLGQSFPSIKEDLNISFEQSAFPRVDVFKDEGGSLVIEADAHGYLPENLSVEYDKKSRILTISGSSSGEVKDDEKRQWIKREIKRGKFSRSFALGEEFDASGIVAENSEGIIRIRITPTQDKKETSILKLL